MPRYQSTKTYGFDRGLSTCFRQWRASHSHCSTLHGYSLGFKFIWESETLDEKNWVFDFGGMKPIKQYLDSMFDHTVLVAADDPAIQTFKELAAFSTMDEWNGREDHVGYLEPTPHSLGRIMALRIVPGVGCEMIARMVFDEASEILERMKSGEEGWSRYDVNPDVRLVSVECMEHAGNSAVYIGDQDQPTVERGVMTVEVDASPSELSERLQDIKDALKKGQTVINHDMVDPLVTSLSGDTRELGDLEPFMDQLNELHRMDPVDERGLEVRDESGNPRVRLGRF